MTRTDYVSLAETLGPALAERAEAHDRDASFVGENYDELKKHGFFTMVIPKGLGGGDASFADTCRAIHRLAQYCPSTALALSMHSHLVAANVWKLVHKQPGAEETLRKIVQQQLVLVSTGATDWLSSNGSTTRTETGYRVNARKAFASGCPGANVLVTSIASASEPEGPMVLHFSLPLSSPGIRILSDWHTLGMRGTGSHTVLLDDVFVPESAIVLRRPQGQWHSLWGIVLGVAPPIYMSAYAGIASAAFTEALHGARTSKHATPAAIGELENAQTSVQMAWQEMVRLSDGYEFQPTLEHSNAQLIRKTLVTQGLRRVLELAVDITGGASFYRGHILERLWRDAQAAHFHPFPARRQCEFTGRLRLELDVTQA